MNFKELFSGVNRRLSNIERFNNTPRIKRESVAEHSYYVAFYAMVLGSIVKDVDLEKAMKIALVHDIEEYLSGDLPHVVKMKYPAFTKSLEEMNVSIVNEIFKDQKDFIGIWKESRGENTEEAKLVKACDILSVLFYTKDESFLGNKFMEDIYYRQLYLLKEFIERNPKYEFLKEMFDLI